MSSTNELREQRDHEKDEKTVTITVNDKPVVMTATAATGLQIKDAAIAQGVKIQRNFTLTEELPGDKSHLVRDDEEVKLHKKSEFTAVTPDDNSWARWR
jgi:hypothetical protein